MGKIAFLFPGQASQYSGMGREVWERFPEARAVFEEADATLGFPLSELCFSGTEDQLKLTENTQPAILTVSVAVLAVLSGRGLRPDFVAGHSLGEYSALVAAGSLPFGEAVGTVRKRGRYMQEAVPVGQGAMAAIVGAELPVVTEICDEVRGDRVLSPANINTPAQVVIAGHREAVEQAVERAKEKGYRKAILLPVSAPFHCRLMAPAEERLKVDLQALAFGDLAMPLVTNVDARLITAGAAARDSLVRQVTGPVRWWESMELLLEAQVTTFIEVGPKNVLSGMLKKAGPDLQLAAVEKLKDIETLFQSLGLN